MTTVPTITEETKIIYHIDEEETPYLMKLTIPPDKVCLGDFKNALNRPNYKFFFKSMDDDFGVVKEEITDEDARLPCFNGRVVSWLVSAEGSNVSDTQSQGGVETQSDQAALLTGERGAVIGDSRPPSFHGPGQQNARQVGMNGPVGPRPMRGPGGIEDSDTLCDTCTDTDSVYSSQQDRVAPLRNFHDYSKQGGRLNGHRGGYQGPGGTYDTNSSMMSSDLESTSFCDSEDESSRFSSVTGTTMSSARYGRHRAQRRRRRLPPISRASSFSSITDSTMSLNIVTVTLNMETVNFLGISIVGQSNKGGDGGIYVGSIMKGGAVAQDGRIEPGDMILEVNGISFEDMSNDDAVRTLREQVQKPGPITLVVAKCWNPNPKDYFTIPRQEPVRPIDPRAWVLHTNAMTGTSVVSGAGPLIGAPSMATLSSSTVTGMSLPAGASAAGFNPGQMQHPMQPPQHFYPPPHYTQGAQSVVTTSSSLPESDRYPEAVHLTVNTDVGSVVRAMGQPDSGLEIRDRLWLKITLPSAFIGSDLVDWLWRNVEGFTDRRDARKYAANLLKFGYIRHTVNKVTFSEQCYYVFGELAHTFSRLSLDEVDSVSEADRAERLAPLPPPNWGNTASTALAPRPGGVGGNSSSSGLSNYSHPAPPPPAPAPSSSNMAAPPPSYGAVIGGQECVPGGVESGSSQYSSLPAIYQTEPQRAASSLYTRSNLSDSSTSSSCSRRSGEKPLLSPPQPPPRTTTVCNSVPRMPMGSSAM